MVEGGDLARADRALDAAVAELHVLRGALEPDSCSALSDEDQATLLAGLLERARAARRAVDLVCAGLAEAALERGASPRMLDWADGREDQ